jgi:selenocysteine lyase/cysteine desulfurase
MSISRRTFVATAASLAATAAAAPPLAAALPTAAPPPDDDPLGVRADFPVASTRTYLNSAYIAPVPRQVVAAGQAFVEAKALQPIALGDMLRRTNEVRGQFARLVNAGTDEIGFLFSTSEGENIVANSLDLAKGDNVVIDELHYETEFVLYREMEKRHGIELRVAKHRDGVVTAKHMEPLVDKRTRLVSVAWVSHLNGYRHDLKPIADLAHAHGALCYVDGIQAVGMFPTDVKQAGIDFLCAGTYKWLLGSFGVAPFYIRRELLDRVRLDRFGALHVAKELPDGQFEIHKTARRFDYSTLPFCEVYQLGAGLTYLEKVGVSRIEQHTVPLARALREGLVKQGYKLFTPPDNGSSIVVYWISDDPARHRAAFEAAKVDVTVRDTKMIRVSPALFNTAEDIAKFLEVTKKLA